MPERTVFIIATLVPRFSVMYICVYIYIYMCVYIYIYIYIYIVHLCILNVVYVCILIISMFVTLIPSIPQPITFIKLLYNTNVYILTI